GERCFTGEDPPRAHRSERLLDSGCSGVAMRPLFLLVLAEFLVLVLLAALWLGGRPAAAGRPTTLSMESPPSAAGDTTDAARSTSPVAVPVLERRDAALAVTTIAADDPLGILVSGNVRCDGKPVEGARVSMHREDDYRAGDSAAPGVYAVSGLRPGE